MVAKLNKKLVSISLLVALCMPLSSTHAATDQDANVDGGLSVGRCIQKGNVDFVAFLNTLIFNDSFVDGVIEPWKDVLTRNQCHSTDISILIKQQDKIRAYIRDAFLTCKNEKVPSLKKALEELNIEIYYVRNSVDGKVIASMPFELLSTRHAENPESLYTSTAKLKTAIVDKYEGKVTLSKEELEALFVKLESKYKDRKNEYIKCENGSWKQVSEKWTEFINSAGGVGPAVKDAEKEIVGAAEKLVKSVDADSLKATYKGWVQVNLNNQDVEQGASDIVKKLESTLQTTGSGSISQKAFLDAIAIEKTNFNTNNLRSEMTTNFKALYKETSDSGTELLVTGLQDYDKTLQDSFPWLDKILKDAKSMNSRECPNK